MGCNSSSEQGPLHSFYSNAEQQPFSVEGRQDQGLKEYLELEGQIRAQELDNPIQMLQLKSQRWHQLQNELETAQRELDVMEKLVATDLGLDNGPRGETKVEMAIAKFSNADSRTIAEQQEYFALLNKEEIALKAVQSLQEEKSNLEQDIKQLRTKVGYLNLLYRQQDQLLDRIFGAEYASDRENILEVELDLCEQKKAAIVQISVLWSQARTMVELASNQLSTAIQLWLPLQFQTESPLKFQVAAEVRDSLVAARQNLLGAHQSLCNVSVPYCTLEELATLSKAIAYVFTDMQTIERHQHAEQCYRTIYLRSKILLQWINQVMKHIIHRDLQSVMNEFQEKTQQLRQERINLIISKMNDGGTLSGRAVFMEYEKEHEIRSSTPDSSLYQNPLDASVGANERNADLAPIPTSAEIFGRVNQLATDHQQELQRYIEELKSNKGKVTFQLKEALNERRRRRVIVPSEVRSEAQDLQS